MRALGILAAFCLLTGCQTVSEVSLPSFGETRINPSGSMKIARIYRSVDPVTAITSATRFKEICQEDFAAPYSLSAVGKYVSELPVHEGRMTGTHGLDISGGLTGVRIKLASAGGEVAYKNSIEYEIDTVRKLELSDKGIEEVTSKIGDDCRNVIKKWTGKGHLVFLTEVLHRANKLKVTVTFAPNIKLDVGLKIAKNIAPGLNFKAGTSNSAVSEQNNVYIELRRAALADRK